MRQSTRWRTASKLMAFMRSAWRREYIQVLRLLETFALEEVTAAIKDVLLKA
jgi:hypothetical protein